MEMYKTMSDYALRTAVVVDMVASSLLGGCTDGASQQYVKPLVRTEQVSVQDDVQEKAKGTPFPGFRMNKNAGSSDNLGSRVAALSNNR